MRGIRSVIRILISYSNSNVTQRALSRPRIITHSPTDIPTEPFGHAFDYEYEYEIWSSRNDVASRGSTELAEVLSAAEWLRLCRRWNSDCGR
jgi:hypothetical protein